MEACKRLELLQKATETLAELLVELEKEDAPTEMTRPLSITFESLILQKIKVEHQIKSLNPPQSIIS